jgi:hypothetical protein
MNVLQYLIGVLVHVVWPGIARQQREGSLVAPHIDVQQGLGPVPSQQGFKSAEVELHGNPIQLALLYERTHSYAQGAGFDVGLADALLVQPRDDDAGLGVVHAGHAVEDLGGTVHPLGAEHENLRAVRE